MTPSTSHAGRRNPSMSDVAALAGVSHQTVSRVLNDHALVRVETRHRVQEAIRQRGYRRNSAARALVTNRSGLIGLVGPHLGLYGQGMIATAVQEAAYAQGYSVAQAALPGLSTQSLGRTVDRLLDQAAEAVVVAVAQLDTLATVTGLNLPVPMVLAQGVLAGQAMAAGIDREREAELATRHLLEMAGGPVAHVIGPPDWVEARRRREGWLGVLATAGAEGRELSGDWPARGGYEAGLVLAADPTATGVFVGDDAMALGLLRALHEQGRRVPEDVAVVGFDDAPQAAHYWPPLSTVRQDFAERGRRAVDLAVGALQGEEAAGADAVVPELVVRRSGGGAS